MTVTPEQHIVTRRGNGITYAECTCGWASGPSYSIDSAHIAGMSHRVEAYQAALRDAEAERDEALAQIDCAHSLLAYEKTRGERRILIGPVLRSLHSTPEQRAKWVPLDGTETKETP